MMIHHLYNTNTNIVINHMLLCLVFYVQNLKVKYKN
jgi:hypothetical protein